MATIANINTGVSEPRSPAPVLHQVTATDAPPRDTIIIPTESAQRFQRLKLTPADVSRMDNASISEALTGLPTSVIIETKTVLSKHGLLVPGRAISDKII